MPNDENEETARAGGTGSENENDHMLQSNTGEEKRKQLQYLSAFLTQRVPNGQKLLYCVRQESEVWIPRTKRSFFEQLSQYDLSRASAYFSTASAIKTHEGYRNKAANFGAFLVLVLDDIGTKAISLEEAKAKLTPTYIVESSAGNYQLGYVLNEPCTEYDRAAALVNGAYNGETSDKGGNLVGKFVRLPAGVRNKTVDGVYDDFPVRLVELTGVTYDMEQLEAAFPPKPVASRSRSAPLHADVTAFDGSDSVTKVLFEDLTIMAQLKPVQNIDGSIGMSCPWAHEHTSGGDNAMYWPLGVGEGDLRFVRGFRCHHGHCAERGGSEFVVWLREAIGDEGGYRIPFTAEAEADLRQFVYIDSEKPFVGDLLAPPGKGVRSLSSFKFKRRKLLKVGRAQNARGGGWHDVKQHRGDAWANNDQRLHADKLTFDPALPAMSIDDTSGMSCFNEYVPLVHKSPSKRCDLTPFFEHCERVIPNQFERETFYDWIAYKLQKPWARSYCVLMVTEQQGVGRSTIGKIVSRMFGPYAGVTDADTLNSQYRGWLYRKLFVVCDEIMTGTGGYRNGTELYDRIKLYGDTSAGPLTFNIKFGPQVEGLNYASLLMFTNHVDALLLPANDRRFFVIQNSDVQAEFDQMSRLIEWSKSNDNVRALAQWFLHRDVSAFNSKNPPMAPAKRVMINMAKTAWAEVFEELEPMLSDLVTKRQVSALTFQLVKDDDPTLEELPSLVKRDMMKWFNSLSPINPEDLKYGGRVTIAGRQQPVKIVRNVSDWQKTLKDGVTNLNVKAELEKNEKTIVDGVSEMRKRLG